MANITIQLPKQKNAYLSGLTVLKTLMNAGWTLNDQGKISYLPLGDKDDFDWHIQENLSFEELKGILTAKEKAKEAIGVIVTWQDTGIGGTVMFRLDNNLSFGLDINRKEILLQNNYAVTDFQWYLEKLLPPLNDAFGVEYFSCDQYT